MSAKRISSRILVYTALLMVFSLAAWAVHNSVHDASWLARQLYPLESLLARTNHSCQGPAQTGLRPLLQAAATKAGSLTAQLAYWPAHGQPSHCSGAAYGEQPDANARFRYASLTKLLTAQAVLSAMQDANLPLDTPLSHFIGQASAAQDPRWQQVTIGQLLTHSAGLDRMKTAAPMTAHGRTPWCPGDLDRLQTLQLDFDPGTGYAYSNLTYCLLGVVLEKLDGTSLRSAMDARFRLPEYGIRFIDGPYLEDEVRYDFRHTGFYGEDYWRYLDFPALSSSAGLSGSAMALLRLLDSLRSTGRLMMPDSPPANCDLTQKRSCYGPALFPYRKDAQAPLLWVQQGYLFGASSLLVLDTQGNMLVWLGNGKPASGSAGDIMLEQVQAMWSQLSE